MTIRLIIPIALAAMAMSAAHADFRTVQRAYEVSLADFQAPATPNGKLVIRDCSTCDQRAIRVDANTRYEINDKPVELQEFRRQILRIRNRDGHWLSVLHHLERDIVTVVSLTL